MASQLSFLGSQWSLWPPDNLRGGMNIVAGTWKVSSDIISVCLTKKGECPLHPSYGLAPDLFEPLSDYAPQYLVYNIDKEIMKWVEDIQKLTVELEYTDYKERINILVRFIPKFAPTLNTLTFGYYDYQGAIWGQNIDTFLDGVALNGKRFTLGYKE